MKKNFNTIYGMDFPTFFNIIDNMYDEIYLVDNNYKLIYVNKACARHYGCNPEDMIGKTSQDFEAEKWWDLSFLSSMYKDKKTYVARQKLFNGIEVTSIAVPILDENDNIEYVVMNVRDEINEMDFYNNTIRELTPSPFPDERRDLVFKSKAMEDVLALAKRISAIDATCIITGKTGVGKTLLAKHMHAMSPRCHKPFISLNCASLPSELLESELFGYAPGSFTGASLKGKSGFLEKVNGGSILLDEISELSLSAQAKILHVCQEKEFFPVGGTESIKVDVKIIAATNKNLQDLVNTGHFREDLFYRLNVTEIYIPPLKRRPEDIPALTYHFLNEASQKYGLTRQITDRAMEVLANYEWNGNVRELRHIVERMVVTSDTMLLDIGQIPKSIFGITDSEERYTSAEYRSFRDKMSDYEAYLVRQAYEKGKSSRKVAELLSIPQTKANTLIQKYIKGKF